MAATTSTSAKAWSPDVIGTAPEKAIPNALIMTVTTQAGRVEGDEPFVRVPVVNDDEATVVPEGAAIPEADPELAEALVQTTKVAKLLRVSREQFHQDGADSRLSQAASRSIVKKADDVLLNQPDNGPTAPPAGLLHQGIPDAGEVDTNLDVLVDAIATAQANGSDPTHIVMAPDTWATLRKFKTGETSAQSLLGVGAEDAVRMLLDIPVIINAAMPAGTGLILDSTNIVSAYGNIESATSADAFFGNDQMGLRAIFRFGATVVHADRHATFSVAADDGAAA